MLYLKASNQIEILDNYQGEDGVWLKTFAMNDKRNKNGWRVTWDSIKRNIADFSINKRPGIEYVKCEGTTCDLDHTDGSTFETSLEIQEPYRVTTIRDYVLDEDTHTAFFIHKVDDMNFFELVKSGKIEYVSPSIWPKNGSYDRLGVMPNGLPKLDVYDWKALHDAFVNDPAFGDEAKITATCEGVDCQMRLLTAKELQASDDLESLEQIPLIVRHKDGLVFVTSNKASIQEIQNLFAEKKKLESTELVACLKNNNNSFSSCSCSSKITMPTELENLKTELETTKSALKAATDKSDSNEKKVKELESKIAKMDAAEKACAKCGSTEHTTSEHTKKNSENEGDNEPDEDDGAAGAKKGKKENPRIIALEAKLAKPMIEKMLAARKENGASEEDLQTFEKSITAKSLAEIEERFQSESILMKNLSAKEENEPSVHIPFNGTQGSLSGKTLESILDEVSA